jgi:hypothetical protein
VRRSVPVGDAGGDVGSASEFLVVGAWVGGRVVGCAGRGLGSSLGVFSWRLSSFGAGV